MNPALPGGALFEAGGDESTWSTDARVGYTFIPYGRLQQGRDVAPNPNQLAIDVHLATLQLSLSAPTGTRFDLQLPVGTLVTSTFDQRRSETGVGDLEIRVRQAVLRSARRLTVGTTFGLAVPTGPYVPRSGAANLAPEASYLTLGRGTTWWLAELDARLGVGQQQLFSQLAGRGPVSRTEDGFAWGRELRLTVGVQRGVLSWLSLIVSTDLQVRGEASEPDPFSDGRLMAANAGGWQWTIGPACSIAATRELSIITGVRAPIASDVTGNQLVPQIGGFVAVSYTRRLSRPRATARSEAAPVAGKITVVDYWASWCQPCDEIAGLLVAASARWPDVAIVKVDATAWPEGPTLPTGAPGLPVVEVFDTDGKRFALLLGGDAMHVVDKVDALRARKGTTR